MEKKGTKTILESFEDKQRTEITESFGPEITGWNSGECKAKDSNKLREFP